MRRLLFLLLFLLSNCTIRGLNDGYKRISKNDKQFIKPYVENPTSDSGNFILHEVTADDIKSSLSGNAMAYVVIWNPWCKGTSCRPLGYYCRLFDSLNKQGIATFLVSDQYEYSIIKKQYAQANCPDKILVMKHDRYGHQNRGRQVHMFANELASTSNLPDSIAEAQSFLIRKDSMLYHFNTPEAVQSIHTILARMKTQ